MPEIAEVARIVHHLKKSLVGKTLTAVKAQDDANVFGKVGTSGAEFQKSLLGKKVIDAGQQGKYFWLIMSKPPHPVLHFGMTGWIKIRGEPTAYYRPEEPESQEWPPKYWKFVMETDDPKVEVAYTDPRRFGRIRLVHCAAKDIRNTTPLAENGPDPVIDKDIITEDWLETKMKSKRVPVKALLLDQANISGIGNYVGDEILYHAKIHPEQYSNTLSSAQLKKLHTSVIHICQTAVDALGDSRRFPEEWIFHHRWGKGKKDAPTTLPTGEKTAFLTVGGRTSFIVPSVQKKTGAVAGEVKKEDLGLEGDNEETGETKGKGKGSKKKKKKAGPAPEESPYFEKGEDKAKKTSRNGQKRKAVGGEKDDDDKGQDAKQEEVVVKPNKKRKVTSETPSKVHGGEGSKGFEVSDGVRRSSSRLNRKAS